MLFVPPPLRVGMPVEAGRGYEGAARLIGTPVAEAGLVG